MICEAVFNMMNQASYANGWEIEAMAELPYAEGTVEVKGVVMFKQRSMVPVNPSTFYGVADYVGNGDTLKETHSIHFSRGTYDMSREQALDTFGLRAGWTR